ncbi:helix-turn-helix transcriptional regulator [Niveibacterium microcysteis]|uniref:Helix-turn-helix domain-containing protein n=1 Tax=Niveibacterium microcysteis TaxID=2811415 RepID=A0ABX7MDA0_9RHOO|nr:helix-turn-helix domain-containing protein [Niveibacterium microcysteis]
MHDTPTKDDLTQLTQDQRTLRKDTHTANQANRVIEVVTIRELAAALKRSRSSIYNDITLGRVPHPIKIGRSTVFIRTEVETWLKDKATQRRHSDIS